jgi:hypothetical protein
MTLQGRVFSVVIALAVFIPSLARGNNDPELVTRIREEILKEWPVVKEWGEALECSGVLTRTMSPEGKPPKKTVKEVTCRRKGDNMLIEVRSRQGGVSVGGLNPKYSFHVIREGKDDSWAISNIFSSGESKEGINKSFRWYFYHCVNPCMSLHGTPLADLVRDQRFQVTGAEQFRSNGRASMKIQYKYTPQGRTAKPVSGWVILSPDEHWTINEFEELIPDVPRTIHGTISYGDRVGSCRGVRRFLLTIRNPKSKDEELFEVSHVSTCMLGDKDFTLPAFGLPEVTNSGAIKSNKLTWMWLSAASIVLLLFGILLRRSSRRKQGQHAS